ncbi:ABC transporter substrate-binding protein [Microlunatus parietis]|uniref:Leucine-binding protein domain-containing protein n=1 Tax=Microlunatus parietis TaxID=682979 RepID=A0A7Y9I2F5_9ACTN|nr:ABC transporter substrate-binding protein [Microlunatus parietis]NYE68815.1 hypothetical protein [Microlunatus parietis]
MSKKRWIILGAVVLLVLGGGTGGFVWWRAQADAPKTEPAVAQPVAISVPGAPAEVKLGVVVTLSSKPGEGSEQKYAAEGAQVAAQRLSMGGVNVKLVTVDDKGSTEGAQRAVEQLADEGVSGIVAATQGAHLRGAVKAAQQAELPLLLPYESDPELLGTLVWGTGPMDSAIGAALQQTLTAHNLKRTLLIDVGGGTPESVKVSGKVHFKPGDDVKNLLAEVLERTEGKNKIDSVLISGPAAQQAVVVQALQGADVTLPIFLSPDATSPAFTAALIKAGGSLSTSLGTVGTDSDDPAALASDETGKAMSAFLAAVRLRAADPEQTTLLGDQPFIKVADAADARSHDAIIALTYAAAATAAREDGNPMGAIPSLRLDHSNGLAGPALDFSHTAALAEDSVVALRSSGQDLGLRPAADGAAPRLIWFFAP